MSRNLFDEIKKVIKDQTKTTPGIVSNLHGVVQDVLPSETAKIVGQQWYALTVDAPKMPSLREFMDAFTFQRLPVAEATADVNLVASHPVTAAGNQASALYGVTHLASSAQLPITVNAPGRQIAVYVGAMLVATGSGSLSRAISLPAGDSAIVVITYGTSGGFSVSTDGSIAIQREDLTPAAPVPTADPVVSYLKAGNGSYSATLSWNNDPFTSGWVVYRSPFISYGVPTTVTGQNNNTEMIFRFGTQIEATNLLGAPVAVNDILTGIVLSVVAVRDVSDNIIGSDVTVALLGSAPNIASSYVGGTVYISTENYNALGRVGYGGDSVISFSDTTGVEGEWYSYRVTALGLLSGTAESDYTPPLAARIVDRTVPGSVTGLAVSVLNGSATASFTTPTDTDYRGVKVFFNDPIGGPTLLSQDQGLPGQKDSFGFHPSVAGTYEFRTFDWAGNTQPSGTGVQWVWDGKGNYVAGVSILFRALINGTTADLTLEIHGDDDQFPVTVEVYQDQTTTPMTIGGGTSFTLAAGGTITKTDHAELGGIALPLTNAKQWWVKVTDADGNVRWDTTGPIRRGGIPGGVVMADDYKTQPVLSLIYDENVTQIVVKKNGVVQTTLTRGSGLVASGGGTATYAVPAIAAGAFDSGWTVEYTGTGATLVIWSGVLHGPIKAAVPPYFDYISSILDAAASDQPRYDLTARMIDPTGLGGTLKVWLNINSSSSANPANAPDYTLAIAAANMPFTANSATAFGSSGSVLNNIKGSFTLPKSIYFEFVNTDGTSTGKVEFKLAGDLGSILNTDGTLKPIGKSNFASTIKPVEIYATMPTAAQGANGDVAFAADTGRLYRKTGGAWVSYTATTQLEGVIEANQIRANSITSDQIAADSALFGEIAAAAANFTNTVTTYLTAGGIDAAKISVNQLSDFKKADGSGAGLGIFVGGVLKSVTTDANGDPIAYLDLNATGSNPILYSTAFSLSADGNASYSGNVDADSVGAFHLTVGTYREGTSPLNLSGTFSLNGMGQMRSASFQSAGMWGGSAKRVEITDDNLAIYSASNVLHALFGTYTLSPTAPGTASDNLWSTASSSVSRSSDGTTSNDAAPAINNLTAASLPANGDQYTINVDLQLDTSAINCIGLTGGSSYSVDGTIKVYYRTSGAGALNLLFSYTISDGNSAPSGDAVSGVVLSSTVTRTVTIPGITAGGYVDIVVVPSITYSHTGRVTGQASFTATGGNVTWPQVASGSVTRRGARFYAQTTGVFNPAFSIEPMTSAPVDANGRVGDVVFYGGALMVHNGTSWVSAGGSSGITQAQADARYAYVGGGNASGTWGISITGSAGSVPWSGTASGRPTTLGGYGITDARQSGPSVILSGNANPYVQFNDGTYTAYWQMASGSMQLYHNGANRISVNGVGSLITFPGTRPILFDPGSGYIRQQANNGGWAMFYGFLGSSGTDRGGFGALGSSDALTYYYIGIYGAEQVRIYPDDAFQVKSRIINMSSGGGPNWFQLGSGASPDSCQIQFGTDNTGYAFGIAKNVSGTITTLARFYDGGSGTTTFRLYGSMEADGNITIPNGVSLYGRRATGNAQVTFFRYDSGTDDLSTIVGGTIWRVRDTGAGVLMSVNSSGVIDSNIAGAGYNLTGVAFARSSSSYNMLYRRDGVIGIYLGGADPVNYYDNSNHFFRDRTGFVLAKITAAGTFEFSTNYGDITSSGSTTAGTKIMLHPVNNGSEVYRIGLGAVGDIWYQAINATTGGYHRFVTGVGATQTERFRVDNNGAVVFGTLTMNSDIITNAHNIVVNAGIIGYDLETFAFQGATVGHYGITWKNTTYSSASGPAALLAGYGGVSLFAAGTERFRINPAGTITTYGNTVVNSGGLYFNDLGGPFLAYWNNNYIQMTPASGAGGFVMYAGAVRGYFYCDSSGFGLLHSGGSWLLKNPYGTLDLVVGNNITANDFILSSDIRLKADLTKITSALDKMGRISGYTYVLKADEAKRRRAGVIAQELRDVLPEAVYEKEDGMLSVAYDQVIPLLIEAIKELKGKVAVLEAA